MNIDKYLLNTTQTSNGVVFKDEEAFKNKKGICYIGEYDLLDLMESAEFDSDYTDEELIEEGIGETYDTILAKVKARWDEFDDEVKHECTAEDVAEMIFNNADWSCVSTEIDQMTY